MQLIAHQEVPSGGVSSIVFDEIPDSFTDLMILVSMRGSLSNFYSEYRVRFNGITSTYTARSLYGNGSTTASGTFPASSFGVGTTATANTFSNDRIYIPNYRSSTAKSFMSDFVGENNATSAFAGIYANLWDGTDPITSIELTEINGGTFLQYTSATLYGITAGSDGIVAVS
jgi:hypothetical protein